jgi:chaperone BCS1
MESKHKKDTIMSKFELDEKVIAYMRSLEAHPFNSPALVIENDNPVWTLLMRYGAYIREKPTTVGSQYELADRVICLSRSDSTLELSLAIGKHRLNWRGTTFEVEIRAEENKEWARVYLEDDPIKCAAFEEFLRYARERSRRKGGSDIDKIVVKVMKGGTWTEMTSYPKRPSHTLITGDKTVQLMIDDMRDFLDSEEQFIAHGFPYKRNYLIIGPKGSGKSSMITVLASALDLDICFFTVTANMKEQDLCSAIRGISNKSMLVIEDAEILCKQASSGAETALSVLTNVLDGTLHKHKLITILTSAEPGSLDNVLVRHGRIDYTARLDFVTKEQVELMTAQTFMKKDGYLQLAEKVWKHIHRLGDISSTVVARFLFHHRKKDPTSIDDECCEELSLGTHTKHISDGERAMPDHFYM